MFRKRSPQEDMFNCEKQYLEYVGKNTFSRSIILYGYAGCRKAAYGYLAAHREEMFHDEDFKFLYSKDNGRPSVPPSLSLHK